MERLELSRAPALSGVLILRTTGKTPGLVSIVSIARDVDDSGWQWLCAQQEALLPAHYKGVHATVWTTVAVRTQRPVNPLNSFSQRLFEPLERNAP